MGGTIRYQDDTKAILNYTEAFHHTSLPQNSMDGEHKIKESYQL